MDFLVYYTQTMNELLQVYTSLTIQAIKPKINNISRPNIYGIVQDSLERLSLPNTPNSRAIHYGAICNPVGIDFHLSFSCAFSISL
jgi:hypothetical protein